jgi:hypothetical protein
MLFNEKETKNIMSLRGGEIPPKQSPINQRILLDEMYPFSGGLLRKVRSQKTLAMTFITEYFRASWRDWRRAYCLAFPAH